MRKIDWNAEARGMVRYVVKHMFEAHRGAMLWKKPGISVAFGNDGAGEKQDREIASLRAYLKANEIEELGFAKSTGEDAGYSWAMIIKSAAPDQFVAPLWVGWLGEDLQHGAAIAFSSLQVQIAQRVVADHGIEPEFVAG